MKSLSLTPLNLFSQQVSDLPNMGNSSVIKSDPRSAQMTIFYGGEVIVFDDCSAEKAKEIVSFVNKGKSQIQNNNNFPYTFTQTHPSFPAATSTSQFPFDMNVIPDNSNNLVQEHHTQAPSRPVSCGLPLTRKASLYRFLEKRKDRIAARTPYQTSNPTIAPYKPAESMSWLALSPHSPQDRSESCSNFV
ncbi:hypothetical protein TanjilG_25861 [Lupinus angustifolius]|uniref:Protein TIFY n=1 Tax=Lupinus angustifolius TaxID=3871 RepID=A0A1J7G2F3_LUPAN|nr:PREDICTED: protein TIFY 10a-like isoform X1 [Lupinus angustifolius]OIV94637.1 hypothetical protein TanjilG_25861 [Lupinus angustifolius]